MCKDYCLNKYLLDTIVLLSPESPESYISETPLIPGLGIQFIFSQWDSLPWDVENVKKTPAIIFPLDLTSKNLLGSIEGVSLAVFFNNHQQQLRVASLSIAHNFLTLWTRTGLIILKTSFKLVMASAAFPTIFNTKFPVSVPSCCKYLKWYLYYWVMYF